MSDKSKNSYNYYLREIPSLLGVGNLQIFFAKHKDPIEGFLSGDAPEDCKNVIREYRISNERKKCLQSI